MKNVLNLLFLLLAFSPLMGQSIEDVTKNYNEAVTGANENPGPALEKLVALLPQAEALGDAGSGVVQKITGMLPTLQYNVARNAHDAKDMNGAIAGFEKTIEYADQYEDTKMKEQVVAQLPILYYSQGSSKLKANDKAGAKAAFNKALALDENYARAYFGIGKTFRGVSVDSMLHYTEKAITMAGTNAKEVKGYKKGARIALSKAAAKAAKAKKNKEAISLYNQALTYTSETDAKNLDKYNYKLGKAYQATGNSAKACAAYKKVKGEKYGKSAKYEMEQTLKCN